VARLLTATPLGPAHRSDSLGFLRVREGTDLARIDRPRQSGARGRSPRFTWSIWSE